MKSKLSIVPVGILVTLALLVASGCIVGSYHQAFAHGRGHRGHHGYYGHMDYGSSGPLIWHPNSPIFCNSGTPSICHPSTPTMGNPSSPTMDIPGTPTMDNPDSQGEGNIGLSPGNPGDNGYPSRSIRIPFP